MILLAIDPGTTESAWVEYDTEKRCVVKWAKERNERVRIRIDSSQATTLVVEAIASYGMSVGASVFTTCIWIGRFCERWECTDDSWPEPYPSTPARLLYRREVKLHLCNSVKAKDGNVRQAIIDRYGGKEQAIGKKATPGPLYGLAGDGWAALGVAITAAET